MNFSNAELNQPVDLRDSENVAIIKNAVTVVLCISINCVNCILIQIFRKHQVFNMNPRYILYIHLVVNDILLLTLLTIIQVISYIMFTINVSLCMLLLTAAMSVTQNNPLTLAVMAVECYVAICFPLKHPNICTVKKTYVVIGLIWMMNTLTVMPDLFVALATESLEFFHSRVFCLVHSIFRMSYFKEKREVWFIMSFVIVWFILFYTYVKIFFAAHAAAADSKKARNTVLLHGVQLILCMLLYFYDFVIRGLAKLFPKEIRAIRYTVTIFVHILPRLISPVIYGLRDKTFRQYLRRYSFCSVAVKTATETEREKKTERNKTKAKGTIMQ